MRLLFRMIFWLTLVLVLLPSVGSQTTSSGLVSAGDAASAAKATVTDLRSFCQRQPEACTVGSQAAALIGHRAQAGAKMLYEYLTEHFGEGESGSPASAGNGSSLAQTAGHPAGIPSFLRTSPRPGADRVRAKKLVSIGHRLSVSDLDLARKRSRRNRQTIRARTGPRPRELFLSETAVSPYI